jgi:hypothetical protein
VLRAAPDGPTGPHLSIQYLYSLPANISRFLATAKSSFRFKPSAIEMCILYILKWTGRDTRWGGLFSAIKTKGRDGGNKMNLSVNTDCRKTRCQWNTSTFVRFFPPSARFDCMHTPGRIGRPSICLSSSSAEKNNADFDSLSRFFSLAAIYACLKVSAAARQLMLYSTRYCLRPLRSGSSNG